MTNQEKKEFLMRYRQVQAEVSQLLLEREEIMAMGTRISPTYSGQPQGPAGGDKIQMAVQRLDENGRAIDRQIEELCKIRAEVEAAIDSVQDENLKLLLRYRYISGLTWERIAVKMSYSYRHTCRQHGKALRKLMI